MWSLGREPECGRRVRHTQGDLSIKEGCVAVGPGFYVYFSHSAKTFLTTGEMLIPIIQSGPNASG